MRRLIAVSFALACFAVVEATAQAPGRIEAERRSRGPDSRPQRPLRPLRAYSAGPAESR